MKQSGKCPKCQSRDILRVDEESYLGRKTPNYLPTAFGPFVIDVPRYICLNCGYSEEWINKKDIPELRKMQKYQKNDL
ncbi:MAG: hypothetical protein IJ375_01635 [Oscillospiraceae bacterium]|nr:hypothetical protein [Oscillospiraceae bacterium]